MRPISAKELVHIHNLCKQRLLNIVRSGKVTIYDEFDKEVTLDEYRRALNERTQDYTPVDFDEYLEAFDFGGTEESAKEYQMKYEEKKMQGALETVEYGLIIDNYSFEPDEFGKVYSEMYLDTTVQGNISTEYEKTTDGKYIIRIPFSRWAGMTPEVIFLNMSAENYDDPVIARTLTDQMKKRITKTRLGELFHEKEKANDDDGRENSTLVDKVNSLLDICDQRFEIIYE